MSTYRISRLTIKATGRYYVYGRPRTIGVDADGALAVWFETGTTKTEFVVAGEATALPTGCKVIGTTLWEHLVWHLAVKR